MQNGDRTFWPKYFFIFVRTIMLFGFFLCFQWLDISNFPWYIVCLCPSKVFCIWRLIAHLIHIIWRVFIWNFWLRYLVFNGMRPRMQYLHWLEKLFIFIHVVDWHSKIGKVSRGIQGEKSSKNKESSRYLVSILEHKQVPKRGTQPGVRKGKRSLLACHTRRKCSMETTRNSV